MDFPSSVRYLYSLGNEVKTIKLGLDRIRQLLAALGHPERSPSHIHIAGTNGKGSVAAMIEATLLGAGYRCGLYTSPHLISPTERIRIGGLPISEAEFLQAFEAVIAVADPEDHPTYFEVVTAMAFWVFRERGMDYVVLETGLGGRLDATNVVDPVLSIITPIDLDHQQYLGNTLLEIGREKAGIIKPGRRVVLAPQKPEARPAFPAEVAGDVSTWRTLDLELHPEGCRYIAAKGDIRIPVECPLPGDHQAENSLTAVVALHQLGFRPEQIHQGIANTRWPGRLEIVRRQPLTYVDGAHNPAAARRLAQFIQRHFAGREIWLVFGVMRDKAFEEIAAYLFPLARRIILTRAGQPRALEPELIGPHTITQSVPEAMALLEAAPADAVVFITGSLFVVGEALQSLGLYNKKSNVV
jgi:dihydrofolate synthase / folylpolyglutamate synthase